MVPVGRESLAERRAEFERLAAAARQTRADATAMWQALTSWLQPGETLAGAVDAGIALAGMFFGPSFGKVELQGGVVDLTRRKP